MKESVLSRLGGREEEQFRLLEKLVLLQSGSRNKKGVDAVARVLADFLVPLGLTHETVEESELGNQQIFRSPAWDGARPGLLLVGHMDTVFPESSEFSCYGDDGVLVRGPGVIDMKGGLVVAAWALAGLSAAGLLKKIPVTLICNSDEEIGSPSSTPLILREARRSLVGFGFECGGLNGEVVTGRKGKGGYLLKVKGKAGHAAFAGPDKASAILEMAHKVIALERLNDPGRKLVVNVGTISGGIGPNTVADLATVEIDTRYLLEEDALETAAKIREIAGRCTVPGTSGELEETGGRLPMEQTAENRNLYAVIERQARQLGIDCLEELRSGVSDANTMARAGIPVVDGLGPMGDCDHSESEYMVRRSLPERTRLAALSLVEAWQEFS